jgi:sulfide:quinone oxidoreductase
MKRIVILGAGFGGLETATGLSAALPGGFDITLIDRSDSFFIGFSKIDVLFGRRSEAEVRYAYEDLRAVGVRFVQAEIIKIDVDARSIATTQGDFAYDYLVVALGADMDHDATPGFVAGGAYEFYTMPGAARLRPVLDDFAEGTLVLGILGLPYKCPPAPYEVAYLMHDHFTARGVRDRITMKMVIPGPRPVPSPAVADTLERLLAERDIELVPSAPITAIDAPQRCVRVGPRSIECDFFVGVPRHVAPAVVRACRLGAAGFIEASTVNLETAVPGVYAVGDVATLPVGDKAVPKAGAFAEDAARTVVSDILLKEGLRDSLQKFEAIGACYFELGADVGVVNANYLGGETPRMTLDGPSAELNAKKLEFEETRRDRWFKR